jgi:hypothetical protein
MKKVLNGIKNVLIGIVGVVYFGFVIFIAVLLINYNDYGVTELGGTSVVIIKEELSSNKYKKGDIVLVDTKKVSKINAGDEIFVYSVAQPSGDVSIDLGIIGETHIEEDAISFENGKTYSMEYVIGSAAKVYEKYGTFLSIIESKWGFLFIALVPSFLIFIYEFYALIVEIKYGKEESTQKAME